ncbi:helix-turn-helix domain-containing protein [bacterium]|nr:helix-turn-helix domain-containing protein [bacterium]
MNGPIPPALRRSEAVPLADRLTWNVSDAAKATGLSARTIQQAIYRDELPAIRVGRRVLLSPDAVRAWLESKSTSVAR